MEKERIELTYSRPGLGLRLLSAFIDFFLFGVASFVLFAISSSIVGSMDFYKENSAKRKALQDESSLFVDGTDIVSYVEQNEDLFVGIRAQKDFLKEHIDLFYSNETFMDEGKRIKAKGEYETRKAEAMKEGAHLFVLEDGALVEDSLDPGWFISFYESEINDHALKIFITYEPYLATNRLIWLTAIAEIYASMTISYFVFYFAIPLWGMKRGRLTIGRSLFKIGMVGRNGLNVSSRRFMARSLFSFVAYVILDIAFLAPLLISVGMLFLSNKNQTMADYISGTYMVDIAKDDIYLDLSDYLERKKSSKKASIENKDFELDNHGL